MQLLEQALQLSTEERVTVVDELLSSLDRTEPDVDALWAAVAEARIDAYGAGRMEAFAAEDVFAEFRRA